MSYLSLSTWSLHRNLGPMYLTRWEEESRGYTTRIENQPEITTLLELPAILAEQGFSALEVCHFHFPETSADYLHKLKISFHQAGIRFYTLLVDYGDIASGDSIRREADITWIKGWIDVASQVGAERVRIIAGEADSTNQEALARSAEALRMLIEYADARGVRVITENFRPLTATADNCLTLLNAGGDRLGLTSDFGNFSGGNKFDELALTVPRSESIHAKAITDGNGFPDAVEFKQCMDIVQQSGYEGPIVLIYDGPHDMWDGINRVKELVLPYLK
jgi:sugar phosphate isomerase/epimerase